VANIFGFSSLVDAEDGYITYDSRKEDAFVMHRGHDTVKFSRTPEGFYANAPSPKYLEEVAKTKNPIRLAPESLTPASQLFVSTVKGNMEGFTKREIQRAHEARKFHHMCGRPSIAD